MNEFDAIDAFIAPFAERGLVPRAPFGPGDDAAVVPSQRAPSCVTTDAVVEGVHFTLDTFSLGDVGHKALAVNLSDLAAMAATPQWCLVALGLPATTTAAQLRALGGGMAALAHVHGVKLIGGNVTRSPVLSLTLTVSGAAPARPWRRSAAKPGDRVFVSGHLGLAHAGYRVLHEGARPTAVQDALVNAQRRPSPHLAWARAAASHVSAGIDVSDGLLQDLGHVCRASGVAIDVRSKAVDLHPALQAWAASRDAAVTAALTGGEDYVLAVTVRAAKVAAFGRALASAGFTAWEIGLCRPGNQVTVDGRRPPQQQGFQHLGTKPG